MKTFRIVAGVLGALSLALLAAAAIIPLPAYDLYALAELYFHAIVVPILTVNMWAWAHPEIIEVLFFGKPINE